MSDPTPSPRPSPPSPRIAVCAPSDATDGELADAEAIGRLLAERGCVLVSGGLGGAMAATCRGAKGAGGVTIGVLPGYDDKAANPWVDHPLCTGLGQARNAVLAATGHALIAVGGGVGTLSEVALGLRLGRVGTLSEVALGLRLGRPVVLLGGWAPVLATAEARALTDRQGHRPLVAATPAEAVEKALAALAGREGRR